MNVSNKDYLGREANGVNSNVLKVNDQPYRVRTYQKNQYDAAARGQNIMDHKVEKNSNSAFGNLKNSIIQSSPYKNSKEVLVVADAALIGVDLLWYMTKENSPKPVRNVLDLVPWYPDQTQRARQ